MAEIHELRPKTPDSEKITVNLGFIDLGRVDLMVRDGFYANRADFIRNSSRSKPARTAGRRSPSIGGAQATPARAVALYAAGSRGGPRCRDTAPHPGSRPRHHRQLDVTPELARAAIASVQVLGCPLPGQPWP